MASVVRMPGVSADSNEAALVEWSVPVGAALSAGDALAVVETEKANVDITVDDDGVLWRTLAEPGDSVEVGNPFAVLLAEGEDAAAGEALLASLGLGGAAAPSAAAPAPEPAPAPAPAVATPAPAAPAPAAPAAAPPAAPEPGERIAASPLVRRLAKEAGVALHTLSGTGPRGRIVRADLERALQEASAAPTPAAPAPATAAAPAPAAPAASSPSGTGGEEIPHTRLRRAIAQTLTASKRNAPHFYLSATVRVDALLEMRASVNAASGTRVSVNDLVIKAVARAFRDVPEMNVIWEEDVVRRFDAVDLAVAIGSPRGLVTPVLRGVEALSVSEVSSRVRDFAARADEGRLKQDELTGGVFTISNLGMFGVEEFSAIINPPHVGILAVGAAVKRPIVVEDELVIAQTMTITASFDHRPVDGVLAARWLAALKAALENPLTILV